MSFTRLTILTSVVAALSLAACNGGGGDPSLSIVRGNFDGGPVDGNVAYLEVDVNGVELTAPDTVAAGEPVVLDVTVDGVDIVPADGDTSEDTGHLHVFIDQSPGDMLDLGDVVPQRDDIIHTTDTTIEIDDLEPGEHTLWVMLGDGDHALAWPDPVGDRVDITVQ